MTGLGEWRSNSGRPIPVHSWRVCPVCRGWVPSVVGANRVKLPNGPCSQACVLTELARRDEAPERR